MNVHEAKTHLSRLLEQVESGEAVIIARHGRPIARLVPVHAELRAPGALKGKVRVGENFDAPLPDEILAAFEGADGTPGPAGADNESRRSP